jgi:hypothetical protein
VIGRWCVQARHGHGAHLERRTVEDVVVKRI